MRVLQEYLYNVFCDPEIVTLPPSVAWLLKRPCARPHTNQRPIAHHLPLEPRRHVCDACGGHSRIPRPHVVGRLAWFIAKTRAAEAKESMQRAGGLSPQLRTIQAQADAMQDALAERGIDGRIYIAMRYWHPFAEEAVQQLVADGLNKLVIVPLYPQFSLSTSGSALRILERCDAPIDATIR